jgi:oligopeptide transport system ATP-binding protein
VQMVFQDAAASLDPRMTVGEIVAEPLVNLHPDMDKVERQRQACEMLKKVGLSASYLHGYPHEFSGGQCQRIGIARALVLRPSLLICDEPVSALDVSIQAQIINLLKRLQRDMKLALIFISHDLKVLRRISNRVLVMYLGRVMEQATSQGLFKRPCHPYTRALLSAIPTADSALECSGNRIMLLGELPSPAHPPSACVFRSWCPWAAERCAHETPALRRLGPNQAAACHFAAEMGHTDPAPSPGPV